ncbi:MAG TPA: hypothetical protein VN783_12375 [Thermoanaerobaculia bacterium]|nr:hypothetical protein [Thermoanaerobaculia bacterium]
MRIDAEGGLNSCALGRVTFSAVHTNLETGFALDRRWYLMSSSMERSKKPDLLLLGRVLAASGVPYAIIGGVALQVHQAEPRTTLDIDLAVKDREELPRRALLEAGFVESGRFERTENWRGPDATPIQFSDDPALAGAIGRAGTIEIDGVPLKIIEPGDLVREKLRAARDPARWRSKRIEYLADALSLVEADPELRATLSDEDRADLDRLPA